MKYFTKVISNTQSLFASLSAIERGTIGIVLISSANLWESTFPTDDEDKSNVNYLPFWLRTAGSAMLVSSVNELASKSIFSLGEKLINYYTNKTKQETNRNTKRSIRKKNTATELLSEDELLQAQKIRKMHYLKYQKVLKTIINTLSTGFGLIRSLDSSYRSYSLGISPFSLYYPIDIVLPNSGPLLNLIRAPLTNSINILLFAGATLYNMRELLLSMASSNPRQDDAPLFGFINTYSYLGTTAAIGKNLASTDFVIPTGTPYKDLQRLLMEKMANIGSQNIWYNNKLRYTFVILNGYSAYHFYANSTQLIKNIQKLVSTKAIIQIEDTIETVQKKKRMKDSGPSPLEGNAKDEEERIITYEAQKSLDNLWKKSEDERKEVHESKEKIKRRGEIRPNYVPKRQYIDRSIGTQEKNEEEQPQFFTPDQIVAKLERINDWRLLSQIKKEKINYELEELSKKLPNGKKEDVTGSEHRLLWHWNNKKYSIKYETPHGKNPGVFKGRKLAKVLNVMEATFLWCWQKDQRNKYLGERKQNRSLEDLSFIFYERPKLSL